MVPELVLQAFGLKPSSVVSPIGSGHIHQTFLVEGESKFVLQRININVFKDPGAIAANNRMAADYLAQHHPDYLFPTALLDRAALSRSDLAPDPVVQFQQWFAEALDASVLDANAMGVATVDANGQPSLRTVLLKYFDATGFVFYTNLESRKANEIAGNPRVALLLYWAEISRQVRITGTATRTSAAESLRYFLTRPRASQIGAWEIGRAHV